MRVREEKGIMYVVLSAILFGIMPMLTKISYQYGGNAYSVAFGRFFFGSILLYIVILIIPGCSVKIKRTQMIQILWLSFAYALVPILLYASYNYIGSGMATTLHFTYPVAVIVILFVFFREKLNLKQIICTILCISGILMLYTPNGQVSVQGVLLALISGLVYSLYIIFFEKSVVKTLPPLKLSFWMSLFSAAEIGLISLVSGNMVFHMEMRGWIAEIALALLATVFALVLFQKGLLLCGAIKASLLSTFEPLTSIIIGVLIFQEFLTLKEYIGIICILLSVVILVVPVKRKSMKK